MIFALAGRRIDLPEAGAARFPLRNVDLVRCRLRALFAPHRGATLICSAACGADLLALETAGALGWRRLVILPFDRDRFRETSVTDRPGDWGGLYDQIVDQAMRSGGLRIGSSPAVERAFDSAAGLILDEAARLAAGGGEGPTAVVVWDGREHPPGDFTKRFADAAQARGMKVLQVSTLE
ncbi:MAG: hypothetical protein P4L56_30470 [Candidatus Sulfopaludibacter sp.]|nr:hypothetical protein [Candidatus Sulfopaludibacter sp.]